MEYLEYCVPSSMEFNIRSFLEFLRQEVERAGGHSVVSGYWGMVTDYGELGKFSKEFQMIHPNQSRTRLVTVFRSGDYVYEFVNGNRYYKIDLSSYPDLNKVVFCTAPIIEGVAFEEMVGKSVIPYPSIRVPLSELEKPFEYDYVKSLAWDFLTALLELVDDGVRVVNKLDFIYEKVPASNVLGFVYRPANRVMVRGFQYV